jgi:tRNA G18 (ribose-2'-O)-methylase SpoU
MGFVEIDDVNDDRLTVYRDLPRVNFARPPDRFIAEGRHLVQRLLASPLVTESILCSERHRNELRRLTASTLPIYIVPHGLLSEIVGFRFHRGMLACGQRPTNPPLRQLVEAPQRGGERSGQLLVVCPQIVDPTNLAGVVRNCSAFGVDGLLLGRQCADVFSRRVARVSMGTIFQLRVRVADDLSADLRSLHDQYGYHRMATVLDAAAAPLPRARCPSRLALIFGSEGNGLDDAWIEQSDQQITLPMELNTDSLNVATAAGVFLYHFIYVASPA